MLDLVKWSFTLPMIAIVLALGVRLASNTFQSILRKPAIGFPKSICEGVVHPSPCAEIGRLRARTHAH